MCPETISKLLEIDPRNLSEKLYIKKLRPTLNTPETSVGGNLLK